MVCSSDGRRSCVAIATEQREAADPFAGSGIVTLRSRSLVVAADATAISSGRAHLPDRS